jgi:hypothetical protein
MTKRAESRTTTTGTAAAAAAVMVKDPATASGPTDAPSHREEIARLAYSYWQTRGCPIGSPEEDWFRAEREIREQAVSLAE